MKNQDNELLAEAYSKTVLKESLDNPKNYGKYERALQKVKDLLEVAGFTHRPDAREYFFFEKGKDFEAHIEEPTRNSGDSINFDVSFNFQPGPAGRFRTKHFQIGLNGENMKEAYDWFSQNVKK